MKIALPQIRPSKTPELWTIAVLKEYEVVNRSHEDMTNCARCINIIIASWVR